MPKRRPSIPPLRDGRVDALRKLLAEFLPADIAADRANNAAVVLAMGDRRGGARELREGRARSTLRSILANEHAMRGHAVAAAVLERAVRAWCDPLPRSAGPATDEPNR